MSTQQDFPDFSSGSMSDNQSKNMIRPLMPPGGMIGNGPSFQNMSPICFPQGPMNMMDPMRAFSSQGFNSYPGGMNPMGMMPVSAPGPLPPTPTIQKEVLKFKSCTLYPPSPNTIIHINRERPPGCRTIFVGSLPDNAEEEHMKEIFERAGNICSIRKNRNNFCHIRFEFSEDVEKALYISGYLMKIDDKDDRSNSGRLHVDYGTSWEDENDYAIQQRRWMRELRHRQQYEEEQLRPRSPERVATFHSEGASKIQDQLKNDDTMTSAITVLITWMERGECNKKTVNTFYSLLQTINANYRRLLTEKDVHEEEIKKLQENFRQRFSDILVHFDHFEEVYSTACKQKSWDNFSKAQRKNIDMWYKQIKETKMSLQEKFFKEYQDDDMVMSDGEDGEPGPSTEPSSAKKKKPMIDVDLRYQNDALKCQMEAYKNEIDIAKQEAEHTLEQIKNFQANLQGMHKNGNGKMFEKQLEEKDKEIKALRTALQVMEQSKKSTADYSPRENSFSSKRKADSQSETGEPSTSFTGGRSTPHPFSFRATTQSSSTSQSFNSQMGSSNQIILTEQEAKLIGLISCFLNVHPMGASPDYIWSYLKQMQINVRASEIEDLLERMPSLFKQEISGCGASLERSWKFTGFAK